MGQNIQLWYQRSDAESVVLHSPPMDASSYRDVTVFLSILSVGAGATVAVITQQSSDPNNPTSWSTTGTAAFGGASGNFLGLAGGTLAGTTVALGPYVRFQATVNVGGGGGGIVWSAVAVARGCS